MIDWERVSDLRNEVGEDNFHEVVAMFLEEVEDVTTRLANAPDPARFEDDLHFLKGSSLNLGFRALAALCQTGEKLAANGQAALIVISDVDACYRQSKLEFLADFSKAVQAA